MKKSFLFILLSVFVSANAKVTLPDILSDNMVLQQKSDVTLWGKSKANNSVTVYASWTKESFKTKSDKDGNWELKIKTPDASYENHSIVFYDGEKTELNNVLIGEVWFCSGQSNMEMPLNGFTNCPIETANSEIAQSSKNKYIRFATIPRVAAQTPQTEVAGKWQVSGPNNTGWFSATAHFFSTFVNNVLDIPVGIINCSWGGSSVEGWLPEDILKGYPDIDLNKTDYDYEFQKPMIMYNGMLKPLQKYTIKGFLWYQGESNVGKHDTYPQRLATMVDLWRAEWNLGELPFYFVEIAPYHYGGGIAAALLRESQFKAQSLIPNSGMISTNDLVEDYELHNIHPKNKKDIGQRLAFMALNRTYGIEAIHDRGPEYNSMEINKNEVILTFDNVKHGFNRLDGMVGFEVAGEDQVFYPALGKVCNDNKIMVVSENVEKPVAVRYCFKNFQIGNVCNIMELPLVPFRTDNW